MKKTGAHLSFFFFIDELEKIFIKNGFEVDQ